MADACLLDETPPLVIDTSAESPDKEPSVTEDRQHGVLCPEDSDENHESARLHKNASNIGQASKNIIESWEHRCDDKLFQGSDGESLATCATPVLSNLQTAILGPSGSRELNNDISSEVAFQDKFSFSDRNTLKAFESVNDLTKSSSILLSIGSTCKSDNKDIANGPLESVCELAAQKSDQNKLDINHPGIVKNAYRCPICMKFTTNVKEALYSHKENCCTQYHFNDEVHLSYSNNTFTCHTCATTFWSIKAEFEEHVVCHITNCPYVCLTCKQNFASRQSIESHTNTEHPSGDAKCGLRGIKKGRKCVEDLIKSGNIVFRGKAIIAKTPRSIIQISGQPEICCMPENMSVNSETQFSVDSDSNSLLNEKINNIQDENLSSASNPSQSIMKVANNTPSNIEIDLHQLPEVADSQMLCKTAENMTITLADYCASTCKKDDSFSSSSQNVQLFSSSKSEATKDLPSCHENCTSVHTVSNVITVPSCAASMLNSCGVETLGNAFLVQCLNSSKPLFSRVDPGKLEPANSEHLNLLFGVSNPETKDIEPTNLIDPTNISTKIQKIAVPPSTVGNIIKSSEEQSANLANQQPKYNVKIITEYTSAPVWPTVTPISTIASHQQQQLFLNPFNPIMQVKQTGQDVTPGFNANSISNSAIQSSINSRSIQQPVRFLQPNNNLPIQQSSTNMPLPQSFNLPVIRGQQNQFNMVKDNGSGNANLNNMHQKTFQTLQAANTSPPMTLHYVPQAVGENSSISTVPLNNAVASLSSVKQRVSDQNPIEIANSQVLHTYWSNNTIVLSNNSSSSCSQMHQNIPKPPPSYEEAVSIGKQSCNTISNGPSVDITQGFISKMKLEQDSMTLEHRENIQKFLFRINPGHGFVCEYCKKFTQNDVIFRRHVFDHFHGSPSACKSCSADCVAKKDVINCSLVNNVLCNLMKSSSELSEEPGVKTVPLKIQDVVVINITEVDSDSNETKQASNANDGIEIIVLDDNDDAVQSEEIDKGLTHNSVLSSSHFVNLDSVEKYLDKAAAKVITDKILNDADGKSTHLEIKDPEIIKETDELHVISASVTKKDADEPKSRVEMHNVVRDHHEEDDNHFRSYLIDKTLTEEVSNSKKLVSDVVGSSLKVFDPTNQEQMEKCIDKSVQGSKSKDLNMFNNQAVKESSDKSSIPFDSSANRQQLCDTEVRKTRSIEEFYMCGYERCSFSCSSSAKYREHLHCDRHQQECTFVCSHCGQKDYIEDSHVRHVLSHANSKVFILYICPISICKFKTNILRMYFGHLSDHKVEELTIKCTYCHKTFPTVESLCEHLKHNLLKFVCCPHCSFKCVSKSVVINHIKMCHPDKPRLVSVSCQIVCYEREINFYVPPVCITKDKQENVSQANSIDVPALLNEVENANSNKAVDSLKDENIVLEPRNPNSVNESAAVEVKDTNVQETKKTKNATSGLGPKSYRCPHCTYLSYNHIYHKQHIALHDNDSECDERFVCNLCPKGVDNIATFKKHLTNHVGKNEMKIFKCTFCTYNTNQKCHIMDHLQDNHDGQGTYIQKVEIVVSNEVSCKHCDFSARNSEQVALHERMLHQEQPVVSVEALKVLPEAVTNDLERGKDKLEDSADCTKSKKYHCDYCQEFFKHKVNLKDHLQNNHKNIECVQFIFYKCKYCSFTSTMKDVIFSHSSKEHVGREVRVLRKIEAIKRNVLDSQISACVSKETKAGALQDGNFQKQEAEKTNVGELLEDDAQKEVQVPDGNTFKHPFMCPICDFSSNLRINLMRHLKTHPELKPVRQKNSLAKKSTTKQIKIPTNRHNSLVQDLSGAGRQLLNPISAVKQPVEQIDNGKSEKRIARSALDSPSMDLYVLGESHLHSALSACFVQVDSLKFQCKICCQKIAKMFVLHRHILDHLKIVLFKCKYCEEGAIERTLMVGHIQREHLSQPLDFIQVSTVDLERQLNEKILSQNFSDVTDTSGATTENVNPTEAMGLVKQPVHELTVIESDDEVENKNIKTLENNQDSDLKMPTVNIKCSKCRYIARNKRLHNMHLEAHDNPFRKFTCSECDYRGDKVAVIKHIYNVLHVKQPTVIEDGEVTTEQEVDKKVDDCQTVKVISVNKETFDKTVKTVLNEKHCSNLSVTDSPGEQVKLPNSGVLELKTLFKCKDCGDKRGSKRGMYKHLQSTKCRHPFFQCSLCSFRSTMKTAIERHAVIRHHGKKVKVLVIPRPRKVGTIQFHVKQSSTVGSERKKIRYIKDGSSNYSSKGLLKKPSQNVPLPEMHTDSNQIKCQLCSNYSTDSVITLQDHITTVHHGTVLYCLKCSYKTPLVKHMINHCKNVHIQKIPLYRLDIINCSTRSCKPEKDGAIAGLNDSKNASFVGQNDSNIASSVGQNDGKNASLVGQNDSRTASLVGQNDSKNASSVGQNDSKNAFLVGQNDSKNAISISKEKKSTVFKCPKCDYKATVLSTIKLHIQRHFAYKPFRCNYCESQFNRTDHIKRHMRVHHPGTAQQKYSIKTDDAIEAKVQNLLDCVMKTNKQNDWYCDICGLKMSSLPCVKRHIETIHHRKRSLKKDSDTESPAKKLAKFQNVETALSTSSENENLENSKSPKKCNVRIGSDEKRKFNCAECSYTTEKLHLLKSHCKSHEPRRYHCQYCNFKTFLASIAFRHTMNIHVGQEVKILNEDTGKIMTPGKRDRTSPASTTSLETPPVPSLSPKCADSK